MKRISLSIITVSFISIFSGNIFASTVLFEHSGSTDPTTEGWTYSIGSGGGTSDGAINDAGTAAWYIEDASTALHTRRTLNQAPSSAQDDAASLNGWMLSTNMRMVDGTTGVYNGIHVFYRNGATDWFMDFDVAPDGDPIIYAGFGPVHGSYEIEGGAGTYHTYSMVFDPNAGSADIFVDGTERISNFTGGSLTSASNVGWGAGTSNATGRAHFNSVQFSIEPVPLPPSLLLLASGLSLFAGRGYFKRKKT